MSRQSVTAQAVNAAAIAPTRAAGRILQRKCECGKNTAGGGQCGTCGRKDKLLQRRADADAQGFGAEAPPIVHEVLRSPGSPLDTQTRSFMEPRFGHDFSRVRVHTDAKAAESALAVSAAAYTVGADVVFGAGTYAPATAGGRRLLAHELTHVVQQRGPVLSASPLGISATHDHSEREADAVAERVAAGGRAEHVSAHAMPELRRTLKVMKPAHEIPNPKGKGLIQTNAATVENYLSTLCATGKVTVDATSGAVGVSKEFCTRPAATLLGFPMPWRTDSPAELSATPTGCGCICDLVDSANSWRIKVDDKHWPHTDFDKPANASKPGGTGGVVTTPSPNSPSLWGAATAGGKTLDIDPWLVLGHELCGHGWLGDSGKHGPDETSPRGEGGHQATVARENELRREHGIELRGTFKQPDCGESYWRDKATGGPVNWSDYHMVCEQWRKDYNKKNKTNYSITDTIP
jgi:hypothetical protein